MVLLSPSYVKNSAELQANISSLGYQPGLISLDTSDAVSMYTNIGPKEGYEALKHYLISCPYELREFILKELLHKLLELVMTSSIFQF